jgi:hypothetical protein
LDDALEKLSFLLEELGISSKLFYQSLIPTMAALRTGRSLKTIALEEKLLLSQDYLTVLRQILPDLEKSISDLKKNLMGKNNSADWRETLSQLDKETRFYQKFQEASGTLIQRLNLIAQEGRLSTLGRKPIDEAWDEIERLATQK